jgi:hypothetical protein
MCGKLKIKLSRLPGHGWEMSIPDQDYWYAALPLPREADQDTAVANVRRRFPDAQITVAASAGRVSPQSPRANNRAASFSTESSMYYTPRRFARSSVSRPRSTGRIARLRGAEST